MMQRVCVPTKSYGTSQKALSVKLLLTYFYITLYFLLFFLSTENYLIFFSTLVVTVVSLWYGPLSVIGSNAKRRILDPATIFNSAMFYYVIKGIPLAWGELPVAFMKIGSSFELEDYPLVALYVLFGIIAWNWAYQVVFNPFWSKVKSMPDRRTTILHGQRTDFRIGVFALSTLGLISFFILFWTIRRDIFVFLTEPVQRAYLTDTTYGAGLSSGYFLLYGVFMLPIASIIWLADLGNRNRRVSFSWYLHAFVCIVSLLLVSPRANLISYVISILIVHYLLIGKLSHLAVGCTSVCIFLYASVTNIWRSIVGSMQTPTLSAGISTLAETVDLSQFIKFFGSPSLADIRIFLLVESFYGRVLPLKYGATLTRVVTQLIPRTLWPSKPYDLGIEIGHLYDPNTISGSPPGFFAEMYINFHVIGVIIGGVLLGALLAFLYCAWILNHRSVKKIVLYAILAPRIFLIPSSTLANVVIATAIFSISALFAMSMLLNFCTKLSNPT